MNKNLSGQALLIVIVSLAVVITVVLSVAARSVTDLRSVAQEEEAQRSFSAAEAGIEKGLITASQGQNVTITDSGELENATFQAQVSDIAQGSQVYVYPKQILSGDSATVWFMSHNQNGQLQCNPPGLPCFTGNQIKLCWGNTGTPTNASTTPAVEITVFYDPNADGNWTDMAIARGVYDPNAGRRGNNAFDATSGGNCTIDGTNFSFQRTVSLAGGAGNLNIPAAARNNGGLIKARVRMLYNTSAQQAIGFDVTASGSVLPGQGKRIESTGKSGESQRKVEAFTLFSDSQSVFDSVVFSPVGIVK